MQTLASDAGLQLSRLLKEHQQVSCMSELQFPDLKNVGSSSNDGIHLMEKI